MPCYRCGTRQVDPAKGESPWARGVRGDGQVLVCPSCQDAVDWRADLDHCPVCSSVHLVRRLGEAECRDCGWVAPAAPGQPAAVPLAAEGDLAREVEQALARVLGRAGSTARG
jgi:hypothetical protein